MDYRDRMAEVADPHTVYSRLKANIERVIEGQSAAVRKLLAALASGGHVLLEDFPGTGRNGSVLDNDT